MEAWFFAAVVFVAICFVFGVVYPIFALAVYPIYRLLGGKLPLWKYMRSI